MTFVTFGRQFCRFTYNPCMAFLIQGLALGLAAASSPGPFQAFLISQALRTGWRRAWPAAFAPLLSDGPVVLLVLLALSTTPAWLLSGLRIAGGLFLLYLAIGAWRSLPTSASPPAAPPAAGAGLARAALTNALSPGPWIFWSTVGGPAFLGGWRLNGTWGIAFLAGFYCAMIAVSLGLIGLFAAAGRLGARAMRTLQMVSASLLAGMGLYQLAAGLSALT